MNVRFCDREGRDLESAVQLRTQVQSTTSFSFLRFASSRPEFITLILLHKPPEGCIITIVYPARSRARKPARLRITFPFYTIYLIFEAAMSLTEKYKLHDIDVFGDIIAFHKNTDKGEVMNPQKIKNLFLRQSYQDAWEEYEKSLTKKYFIRGIT